MTDQYTDRQISGLWSQSVIILSWQFRKEEEKKGRKRLKSLDWME